MDNQHRKISGYRDFNEAEIALINEIKQAEGVVMAIQERVAGLPRFPTPGVVSGDLASADPALAKLAHDHLMIGFMLLVRAVAQPGKPAATPAVRTND